MLRIVAKGLLALVYVVIFGMIAFILLVLLLGWKLYCVQTGSMEPTLPVGTMVVVEQVAPAEMRDGEIVTYSIADHTIVTHRLVRNDRENRQLETKGDNNSIADTSPVSYENVIGRVKFFVPFVGYAVLLLNTRFGKLMLGIAAFALIGIIVIKRIYYNTPVDETVPFDVGRSLDDAPAAEETSGQETDTGADEAGADGQTEKETDGKEKDSENDVLNEQTGELKD